MLDEEFLKSFGFNLKMCRLKRGLTQAELGEKIDVSEHRLSEIERGKCNITLKTVNKIANALNVASIRFFDFKD